MGDQERAATVTGRKGGDGGPRADRRLTLLLGLAAGFYLLGFLGLALLPILTRDGPLLLILINPTSSVLFLVSARVELVPFVVVATLRRFVAHIVFFLLGRWYAERAIAWIEERSGGSLPMVRVVERSFARVGWLLIAVWPGPIPSVLAGAGRWHPALFFALDLAAVAAAVLIARLAAEAAASPLDVVLRFIDQNAEWLTVILVIAVIAWLVIRRLRERGKVAEGGAGAASE